jgi:hypothetical protein
MLKQMKTLKFSFSSRLITVLLIAVALSGCATKLSQGVTTVGIRIGVRLVKNQHSKDVLTVHFEEVSFKQIEMATVLVTLANAIYNTQTLPRFEYESPN